MGTSLRRTPATLAVVDRLRAAPDVTGAWGLQVIRDTGLAAGSVYPILARLETAGWVTSAWEERADHSGPRRRYYRLTAFGHTQAVALLAPRSQAPARTRVAPA